MAIQRLEVDMSYVARMGVAEPDDLTYEEFRDELQCDPDYYWACVKRIAERKCSFQLDVLKAVDKVLAFHALLLADRWDIP